MKKTTILSLAIILTAGQAWGIGLIGGGPGTLSMDPDNLHTASSYDFNRDGLPNLVQDVDNVISVLALDGSTLWSATIDTLAICPSCTSPTGYWSFYFEGFFEIEPGYYDALVGYYYDDWNLNQWLQGVLVISTLDSSVRYQFPNRGLEAAVDLDGDNLVELGFWVDQGVNQLSTWEVWGHNGVTGVPKETESGLWVGQNSPNPFNPQTTVNFELARSNPTSVEIHDASGRLVYRRPLGELQAGSHKFTWRGVDRRGSRVASGTYIVTIVAGEERQTRKVTLLK